MLIYIWCIRKVVQKYSISGGFLFYSMKWTFISDIENSTKQSFSSCKTEIAKPDADKNSFVTVLTVIAVVCIACVMVFLFKEPRQDHSDKKNATTNNVGY